MVAHSHSPHRWPSQCLVCRRWPAATLCGACVRHFARPVVRCRSCALPVPPGAEQCGACIAHPPPMQRCLAAVDYAWPWSACIARFKFQQDPGLAAPLADLLRRTSGVAQVLGRAHLVVAIPCSGTRLAERGYNPALLLARRLHRRRCRTGLLQRTRDTAPQRGLTRAERLKNLRGAFTVQPDDRPAVQGRRVVLVDDVMTTGATLREAATALLAAGAAEVIALALARD